jgi:hypothetical protein
MSIDFYLGCFAGFVFATFIGLIIGQIRAEQKNVGIHKRPQVILGQSTKTPEDLVNTHRSAVARIIGWSTVLVVISAAMLFVLTLF